MPKMPKVKMPTVNTKDLSEKVTKAFTTARAKAKETTKTVTATMGAMNDVVNKDKLVAQLSKLGFVTRKEFDALEARLEQLEAGKKARKASMSETSASTTA